MNYNSQLLYSIRSLGSSTHHLWPEFGLNSSALARTFRTRTGKHGDIIEDLTLISTTVEALDIQIKALDMAFESSD